MINHVSMYKHLSLPTIMTRLTDSIPHFITRS